MSRGGFKIIRSDYYEREVADRVGWIDSFAKKIQQIEKDLPTTAVDAARERDHSWIDQISAIVSRNPHRTVESVVQDYQDKIGLKEWLTRSSEEENKIKQAQQISSVVSNQLPESFQKFPNNLQEDVINYIRNNIETHHGNVQVPAIVEDVLQIFKQRGISSQDVNQMEFEKYISDQILNCKKNQPNFQEHNVNLGKGVGLSTQDLDGSNEDIFKGLNPVKN